MLRGARSIWLSRRSRIVLLIRGLSVSRLPLRRRVRLSRGDVRARRTRNVCVLLRRVCAAGRTDKRLLRVSRAARIGALVRVGRALEGIGQRLLRINRRARIVTGQLRLGIAERFQEADIRAFEGADCRPIRRRSRLRGRRSRRIGCGLRIARLSGRRSVCLLAGRRGSRTRRRRHGCGLRVRRTERWRGRSRTPRRKRQDCQGHRKHRNRAPRGAITAPSAEYRATGKPLRPHGAFIATVSCRSQGQVGGKMSGLGIATCCSLRTMDFGGKAAIRKAQESAIC